MNKAHVTLDALTRVRKTHSLIPSAHHVAAQWQQFSHFKYPGSDLIVLLMLVGAVCVIGWGLKGLFGRS